MKVLNVLLSKNTSLSGIQHYYFLLIQNTWLHQIIAKKYTNYVVKKTRKFS